MITDFCFKRGFDVCLITKLHFKKGHHLKQMSLRGWNHCTTLIVLSHQHHVCVCVCVFRLGFFQKSHYRTWPQSSEPKYLWKVQDFYLHDAILCLSGRLKMTENDNQNKINGLLKKKEDCWCGARLWEPYGFAHPHKSLWKQDDSFDFEKRGGKKGNFFEIKLKCSDNFAFYRISLLTQDQILSGNVWNSRHLIETSVYLRQTSL